MEKLQKIRMQGKESVEVQLANFLSFPQLKARMCFKMPTKTNRQEGKQLASSLEVYQAWAGLSLGVKVQMADGYWLDDYQQRYFLKGRKQLWFRLEEYSKV